MRTHMMIAAVAGSIALVPGVPAAAQVQLPRELRDTLIVEEVLRQREVVDSAQRVALQALHETSREIQSAFQGLAGAEELHRDAMEAWLSAPGEETETAYVEAAGQSINASVRHLDPMVNLGGRLRRRLAPVRRYLEGNMRTLSQQISRTSSLATSVRSLGTEHEAMYDRLAYRLVESGAIDHLDSLSLSEKADLMAMETTGRMLGFVGATMTRHEAQLRASRERLRRYVEALDNSEVLAETVGEQAAALKGAFQVVAMSFGEQLAAQEVERAFAGTLDLEQGLQVAATSLLDHGKLLTEFTIPDPSGRASPAAQAFPTGSLRERITARYDSLVAARGRSGGPPNHQED